MLRSPPDARASAGVRPHRPHRRPLTPQSLRSRL